MPFAAIVDQNLPFYSGKGSYAVFSGGVTALLRKLGIGYAEADVLTEEMIHALLKRVIIYPGDVVEVQLNFTDELETMEKELLQHGNENEICYRYA